MYKRALTHFCSLGIVRVLTFCALDDTLDTRGTKMARTLEQKIAEAQANLARLKDKARSEDTRQKIVVGAAVISQALRSSSLAGRLLAILEAEPLRDHDKKAVAGLVDKLKSITSQEGNNDAA
jgi:hypothetical protein